MRERTTEQTTIDMIVRERVNNLILDKVKTYMHTLITKWVIGVFTPITL